MIVLLERAIEEAVQLCLHLRILIPFRCGLRDKVSFSLLLGVCFILTLLNIFLNVNIYVCVCVCVCVCVLILPKANVGRPTSHLPSPRKRFFSGFEKSFVGTCYFFAVTRLF